MKVFIVVPAFNEGSRLSAVLAELSRTGHEVVVVDDGSKDRTAQEAQRFGCYVLRHPFNRGQGAALQTGIAFALREGADAIVTFDADGQHQTSDLPALLEPVLSGRADVALGNRFLNGQSNVPPVRKVVLQLGRLFTWLTAGVRVGDCHNGYRAFSRKGASAISMKQDRMAHASEIYDQIKDAGLVYEEVPVTIRYSAETLAKGQKLSNSISVLFQYLYGKIAQ
ncbi:MAG TPA: glycosyltransferase family 2 protein [Vicinamibacterales bacterium]|nr:glycosyltransferase family 2 protein [Vicinamibacterales bacterium]